MPPYFSDRLLGIFLEEVSTLIKRLLLFAAESAAFTKFITLLEQVGNKRPNLLRVLTYHRVAEPEAQPTLYPRVAVTPEVFEQQMRYLAANYHVVSMPELLDTYQNGVNLPPRAVMITFDDAYSDFAEQAWPILRRYQLPVTLFVPTAFPDQPERVFWWDWLHYAVNRTARRDDLETPLGRLSLATVAQREQTFSQLRNYVKILPHREAMVWVEQICSQLDVPRPQHSVLGWDALRRLASESVTLGAHTQTHPLLTRLSLQEAQAEAAGSLQDLKREIGSVLPVFAYPGGEFNDEVVRSLKRAGFALAFTTSPGVNVLPRADRLRLHRINLNRRATLPILRTRLAVSQLWS
jgi:peptidoglycan/xylan/chitin deacetylase (PgdA/CDA1 family)